MDYPFLENLTVLHFLQLYFSGLKIIFFFTKMFLTINYKVQFNGTKNKYSQSLLYAHPLNTDTLLLRTVLFVPSISFKLNPLSISTEFDCKQIKHSFARFT